jgi:hypothetical protein
MTTGENIDHEHLPLIGAGDNVHAASVTIVGQVKPGTDFDPDDISEMFWTAHGDAKDRWQTEYRFKGGR